VRGCLSGILVESAGAEVQYFRVGIESFRFRIPLDLRIANYIRLGWDISTHSSQPTTKFAPFHNPTLDFINLNNWGALSFLEVTVCLMPRCFAVISGISSDFSL